MVLNDLAKRVCDEIPDIRVEEIYKDIMVYFVLNHDGNLITDEENNGAFSFYPIAFGQVLTSGNYEKPTKTIVINTEGVDRKINLMIKDGERYPERREAINRRILIYISTRDNFLNLLNKLQNYKIKERGEKNIVMEVI